MNREMRIGVVAGMIASVCLALVVGCTTQSTKLAMEGSRRTDEVRTFVCDQQHRSLKIAAFRETLAQLNAAKSDEDRAAILNLAWNDLDLFEFWHEQDLMARAMHLVTVDAKLTSSQGMIELLGKQLAKLLQGPLDKVDDWLAAEAGKALSDAAANKQEPTTTQAGN